MRHDVVFGGKCWIRTNATFRWCALARRCLRPLGQLSVSGGSGRIRTHGAFPPFSFQDCCHRPLGHASKYWCPRQESNPRPPAYKAGALPTELQGHGCQGRHRTCDHGINSAALYQLSYSTKNFGGLKVWWGWLDSNQLSRSNRFTVCRASPSAPHPRETGINNSSLNYWIDCLNWSV
jgi:hypothetical protein